MARILPLQPLLLILLLLLALDIEGASKTNLIQHCPANFVVKEKETKVISLEERIYRPLHLTELFVKPGSDFKSLLLVLTNIDGAHNTTRFPVDECFPSDDWWKVVMMLNVYKSSLGFTCGECQKRCFMNFTNMRYYSIQAHGASSWRYGLSKECKSMKVPHHSGPDSLSVCMKLPSNMTTSPGEEPVSSPSTLMPLKLVVVEVVVVVVAVVVVVMVVRLKKCLASSNEVRFQPQPAAPSHHLQLTTGQGRTTDQDEEAIYYEILPDFSERRVVVRGLARDTEEPVYDNLMPDRGAQPHTPVYENVPLPGGATFPHRLTEALGVSEAHIYDTVL